MLPLKYKKLRPDAFTPEYATSGSSGLDLYACEDYTFWHGASIVIPTGIAVDLAETLAWLAYFNLEIQVRPRSGLAKKGMHVHFGTIDEDYQGDISANCLYLGGALPLSIKRGDRIAQIVVAPIIKVRLEEVQEFATKTERGTGGFGSTGR